MQRHVLPVLILALAVVLPARASHHHKASSSAKAPVKAKTVVTGAPTVTKMRSTKGSRLVAQTPAVVSHATKAKPKVAIDKKKASKVSAKIAAPPAVLKSAPVAQLARITAYWTKEDYWTSQHMSSTGVHLQAGRSCAVDPQKIPYGSVVKIPGMGNYLAVDTGSAVVSRKAAVGAAHTASQRDALVVDLFFENEQDAQQFAAHGPTYAAVSWTKPLTATDAPLNPRALPAVVAPPEPAYVLAGAPSMADARMPLAFRSPQL